jgi:hypothetical protein
MNIIIESSPVLPLVLPVTPLPEPEHDTDPVLPASPVAEVLDTPKLFILASQGDEAPRPYSLDAAPVEVFNDWVNAIIAAEQVDDPLALFIIKKHSETWDDLARLWIAIDLQVRGIDIAKHAYASREMAERAVGS